MELIGSDFTRNFSMVQVIAWYKRYDRAGVSRAAGAPKLLSVSWGRARSKTVGFCLDPKVSGGDVVAGPLLGGMRDRAGFSPGSIKQAIYPGYRNWQMQHPMNGASPVGAT